MMLNEKEKAIVIKFGGSSVIDSDGVKEDYIRSFLEALAPVILDNFAKATFIVGGGKRVRERQALVETPAEKDIVGIETTQEHAAQLMQIISEFGIPIVDVIPTSLDMAYEVFNQNEKFAMAMGGLQIGQTTDAVAVSAAEILQSEQYQAEIVILSNVASIFTSDPRIDSDARPIKNASIDHMVELGVLTDDPDDFRPGMSVTIDPIAVGRLRNNENNIPLYFGEGKDFESLGEFLNGQTPQRGTIIDRDVEEVEYHS